MTDIDISKLIPSYEFYSFIDVDGEKQNVKIYVPFGYNMIVSEYDPDKGNIEKIQHKVLSLIFKSQNDFMDEKYIAEKIPAGYIDFLFNRVTELKRIINDSLDSVNKKKIAKVRG